MSNVALNPNQERPAVVVAHVADAYHRYPGETVTFYTRVEVNQTLPNLTIKVTIPAGLALETYRASPNYGDAVPRVETNTGGAHLVWQAPHEIRAGTNYEFQAQAKVGSIPQDLILETQASVTAWGAGEESAWAEETTTIAILAKGKYLNYLPALYQDDDLMGRFLMLFESFWAPIEKQLDHMWLYFDPRITTSDFLSWLASWIDLALDERWPEANRRRLLRSAVLLYQKRGTKTGLREYLEIYGGEKVEIIEHRAKNFELGAEARLGPGIALGTRNMPHTFTVMLKLPSLPPIVDEAERARQELERRRMVETIIEAEKPAHTAYTLHIETTG